MMGGHFKKDTPDEVATEVDLNTRKGVERIIRQAFEHARLRGRTKVVMADKSNVLIHAHELWQRVFKQVAAEYAGIEATTSSRTTSRCRWCAIRHSSRSSSPATCSGTSSRIWRPRCRAV